MSERFAVDTNVALYAFTLDDKRPVARQLLERRPLLSVQVFNEFANVARRKLAYEWPELSAALAALRRVADDVVPITEATHVEACRISQRYQLSVYDAVLVSVVVLAGCRVLFSEDMHDGLIVDGVLRVVNPFNA